jgi:hypothetical protein
VPYERPSDVMDKVAIFAFVAAFRKYNPPATNTKAKK